MSITNEQWRAVPLITSDIVIVKRHETNALTLRYTPTPSSISRFNYYRFSLQDASKKSITKEKTVDDPDRKVSTSFPFTSWNTVGFLFFSNGVLNFFIGHLMLKQC